MQQIQRLLLFALVATTIACGQSNAQSAATDLVNTENQNEILRVQEATTLNALDKNGYAVKLEVNVNDNVIVVGDEKSIGDGRTWVSVVIDRNDGSASEIFYAQPEDLQLVSGSFVTMDDDADWSALTLADLTDREARMTYCYKFVKQYLLKIGLVKSYLPGGSAWMAASILPKYGFSKVSRKPNGAAVNDVCVYKGGPSGHGHIESKTSKGWYYGYGYKSAPIQNRIFIGCFHK